MGSKNEEERRPGAKFDCPAGGREVAALHWLLDRPALHRIDLLHTVTAAAGACNQHSQLQQLAPPPPLACAAASLAHTMGVHL